MSAIKLHFYQYRPLKSLEHLSHLKNYLHQKMWFARIDELNDPFEGRFNYIPATAKEILNSNTLFKRYCCDLNLSPENLKKALKSSDANKALGIEKRNCDWFSKHGVSCFTTNPSNIPMWAHYADDHKGYCIEFELDLEELYSIFKNNTSHNNDRESFDDYINSVIKCTSKENQEVLSFSQQLDPDKNFIFTKVLYINVRPKIEEIACQRYIDTKNKYDLNKYIIQNSVGAKFEQWSYEQEYRLLVNANSKVNGLMHLKGYSFLKITGIILGEKLGQNMNEDMINFIRSTELNGENLQGDNPQEKTSNFIVKLAQKHNIKIYLAQCSDSTYKIDITEYCAET